MRQHSGLAKNRLACIWPCSNENTRSSSSVPRDTELDWEFSYGVFCCPLITHNPEKCYGRLSRKLGSILFRASAWAQGDCTEADPCLANRGLQIIGGHLGA